MSRAPVRDAGNAERLDDAMNWLLNAANLPQEVIDHFWHVADGQRCRCVELGRVDGAA